MKKIKISHVVTAMAVVLVVMLLIPDTKAWISRGLMKIGLFKPDLTGSVDRPEPAPHPANRKPAVVFKDGQGNPIDATNLTGKVVFINFWATWCPPCIAEMPSIDKLHQQFKDNEDIVFLMVDVDNQYEKSKRFMESKKLGLPVHVPAGEIPGHWLGGAIPTTIILDKQGEIAAKHEGMADYSRPEVADFLHRLIAE